MANTRSVAVVVGSLRKASFSRRTALALAALAPASLRLEVVEIRDLPHYDQDADDEGSPPAAWGTFRERIRAADAVIFVTPEYNRSIPGVLKNAIDVGSRPYGKSAWSGKPAAVVSVSPGSMGAFGANHALRQSLVFLDMPVLQQPEAYLAGASKMFDAEGELARPETRELFEKLLTRFAAWIEATRVA